MKDGLKVALAVIAGYYLGRHHKMRFAFMLALAILVGRLRGEGALGTILQQGGKILGSSPELGKITDKVKGDLIDIGKAAALRATSNQIDSLSDKLHERAEAMRRPAGRARPAEEEEEEEPREARRRVPRPGMRRRPAPAPEPEEAYEEEEEYEEPYDEEEELEPEERPRPQPPRPTRPVTRSRR